MNFCQHSASHSSALRKADLNSINDHEPDSDHEPAPLCSNRNPLISAKKFLSDSLHQPQEVTRPQPAPAPIGVLQML